MSNTALLIAAAAACAGLVVGWLIAKSASARITAAAAEEAAAKTRAASDESARLKRQLAEAERERAAHGESRKRAEEVAAQAKAAVARAAEEAALHERQLHELKAALEQAQQRAKSLDEDLQRAYSKEPSDTLRALQNDPAIGPGQFQALKLMYEQFTAKSVLGTKPGNERKG